MARAMFQCYAGSSPAPELGTPLVLGAQQLAEVHLHVGVLKLLLATTKILRCKHCLRTANNNPDIFRHLQHRVTVSLLKSWVRASGSKNKANNKKAPADCCSQGAAAAAGEQHQSPACCLETV